MLESVQHSHCVQGSEYKQLTQIYVGALYVFTSWFFFQIGYF